MMKFKRGMKVEIFNDDDGPPGSWFTGMIIYGNGRHYNIKCDTNSVKNENCIMERVPRKSIRPCPPLLHDFKHISCGAIIEILCNFSWKIAIITCVLSTNCFLVRILGTWQEFEVKKEHIRPRLAWKDNKWLIIGKGRKNYKDVPCDEVLKKRCPNRTSKNTSNCNVLKRLTHDNPPVAHGGATKYRAIEREGRFLRIFSNQSAFVIERMEQNDPTDIDNNDKESISSSVGSCSIFNSSDRTSICPDEEGCGSSSDAESCYSPEDNDGPFLRSTDNECMVEIHRLEQYAYRSTIEALYASGPLSWEKECLMTDLRIFLHISNDEHLKEVRNLALAYKN